MSRPTQIAALLITLVVPSTLACNGSTENEPAKTDAAAKPAEGEAKPDLKIPPGSLQAEVVKHEEMDAAPAKANAREVTPSGETRKEVVEGLALAVPAEWERAQARSSMRKAEFIVPGPGGDVRMVVYRFPGGAGGISANIERWKGQIAPPTGGEAKEPIAKELEVGNLRIASVDAVGAFAGQSMPGAPPQPPIADARLLAAAIEGYGDAFYFKMVGEAATIDVWAPAFATLLEDLTTESTGASDPTTGAPADSPAPTPG